jgi:acyl-CoA dehydrogenase
VHCSLATGPLVKWGSDHIKQTYLPKMATGEWIGAYALSEAGSGSDAASLQCKAVDEGDHFLLNGTKMWVTTGDQADVIIVFTRTDPNAEKASRGITAFVIETTWPGFSIGKVEKKLGIRASHTCELIFENCQVPKENVLGEVNRGFPIAMDTLDGGRIGIASQSLGITRACLDAAVKYSQERKQFGKPLSSFQAIQHKITEIATRLDAARLLTHRAAWLKDLDLPHGKEAAMAKLSASRTANFAAFEALQVHAGVGFTREFPVERHYRDARITEIYEGTTEILKLVIARAVLQGVRH